MSTIKTELMYLVELASQNLNIPDIKQVFMPEPKPAVDKDSEFGIVVLEDNSAGLYYAWMGEAPAPATCILILTPILSGAAQNLHEARTKIWKILSITENSLQANM